MKIYKSTKRESFDLPVITLFLLKKGGITMTGNTKELKERKNDGITRRQFFKISATGAVIAGTGTLMFPRYGAAKPKTLKILQWVHFVVPLNLKP
jgi:hypothetical protein